MLLSLLKFEWQYHIRQPIFMLSLLVCTFLGSFLIHNQPLDSGINMAGSYYLTHSICTLALMIMPFLIGAFTANAIVRDRNADIAQLIFSTAISKFHYLFSRWLGLIIMCSLIFVAATIGIVIGLVMDNASSIDLLLTTWRIMWASAILILPAIILLSSLLFAVGLFSNHNIVVYIGAVMVFLLYQLFLIYSGSPLMGGVVVEDKLLQQLFASIDPYGGTSFFEQVKYWSPAQRNQQTFELNGMLLYNRLGILALSAAIFIACYYKFEFKLPTSKMSAKKLKRDDDNSPNPDIAYQAVPSQLGLKSAWLAFASQTKLEYFGSIKTKVFATTVLFLTFVLITEILAGFTRLESLGVTPIISTAEALWRFQYDVLPNFVNLFVVFFAAEMAWRDDDINAASFTHASPVANISLFFAKFMALLLLPLTFITVAISVAAGLQLIYGSIVEWPVYLSLYYYLGLPMICIAALCLFIHSISANKFIGMACSLVIVIATTMPLGQQLGLEHGMFKYSTSPVMQYSDINGFGAMSDAFNGYIKYWLSLASLMVLMGYGLYRRSIATPLSQRLRFATKQWGKRGMAILLTMTLATLYFGHDVYNQTNNIGHYLSSKEHTARQVAYEQKYAHYQTLKSPKIIKVKTNMALYPAERRYQMSAQYTLLNPHDSALSEILISIDIDVSVTNINIDGATLVRHDRVHGQYTFALDTPMLPATQLKMSFDASQIQNGYLGLQRDNVITDGFSYVQTLRYMPYFGYNKHRQLTSPALRLLHGLPALPKALSLEQDIAKHDGDFSSDYDWLTFETTVSTADDEIAIAPGKLLKQWQAQGRNYFHYKTSKSIRNVISYLSGRYKIAREKVDGIVLEVYYLAAHQSTVSRTLAGMSATIKYANQHFGRYGAAQLRLLEVPRSLRMSGYAMPQTILISESLGFRADLTNDDAFDQVFRRTAHEVAHQWWGHGLDSAHTEGGVVLVETLAKYTELMVLEARYGKQYVRRLLKYEHRRYFSGRGYTDEHELPLYRASASHLVYSKGGVAMYALKEELGQDAINTALSYLMKTHDYPQTPATTLDFIDALKSATTIDKHAIIDRWLTQIIIDDFAVTSASYQPLNDGKYKVDVCFKAKQIQEDGLGNSHEITTDVSAWLGVFSKHPNNLTNRASSRAVLKLAKVVVHTNENCLNWTVAKQPSHVAIDPFYQAMDQQRDNNVRKIKLAKITPHAL